MTDINRRDTSEISELSRAVFENPQVFVDRAESRFRDQLRGMTEKVAASGSHIVLLPLLLRQNHHRQSSRLRSFRPGTAGGAYLAG